MWESFSPGVCVLVFSLYEWMLSEMGFLALDIPIGCCTLAFSFPTSSAAVTRPVRNKHKYAALDEAFAICKAMKGICVVNFLECKMNCSTSKDRSINSQIQWKLWRATKIAYSTVEMKVGGQANDSDPIKYCRIGLRAFARLSQSNDGYKYDYATIPFLADVFKIERIFRRE